MKHLFAILLGLLILTACQPSPEEIAFQTEEAKTAASAIWTVTPSKTPTQTLTMTPTATMTPTLTLTPTITPTPTPTQIAGGNAKVLMTCNRENNKFFSILWIYDIITGSFEKVFPDRSRNRTLWYSGSAFRISPSGQLVAWQDSYARNVNIGGSGYNASIVGWNDYISDSNFEKNVDMPLHISAWITDELILYYDYSQRGFHEDQIYLGNIDGSYLEHIGSVPWGTYGTVSPNGKYVLLGVSTVLDVEKKKIIRTGLSGNYSRGMIQNPWFGDTHFYYYDDGYYYSYDLETKTKQQLGKHGVSVWMSPDGEHFADSKTNTIISLSGEPDIEIGDWEEIGYPKSWSPDGKRLLLYKWKFNQITVYDLEKEEILSPQPIKVSRELDTVIWSPDGKWFILDFYNNEKKYLCNYESCQLIMPPGMDGCDRIGVFWLAEPDPDFVFPIAESPGYIQAHKYLDSHRSYILDDYLYVSNSDNEEVYEFNQTMLEFDDGPFGFILNLDNNSHKNGGVTMSGGRPKSYGKPWQGYTRMMVARNVETIILTITDGFTEDGILEIRFDIPENESVKIMFNDIQGKSFAVLNSAGEVLAEYDLTKEPSLDMYKGLFPNEQVIVGTKVYPNSTFKVYEFRVVEELPPQ